MINDFSNAHAKGNSKIHNSAKYITCLRERPYAPAHVRKDLEITSGDWFVEENERNGQRRQRRKSKVALPLHVYFTKNKRNYWC